MGKDVKIESHIPDFNDLASEVEARATATIANGEYRCIFLNPIATVLADEPTPAFFRAVRQQQRRWFKQADHVFPRSLRRSVREYIADSGRMSRTDRFLHRARCWTGVLYQDGWLIQPDRWKEIELPCNSDMIAQARSASSLR
ncbi:hypothetical protein SAMN06265222_101642 [Neorhodopirellula lusitana]|uniref:Uncharacterized protein n=1 Tax=Neorhodopirellula lusitana TaxID=445327 RepID=A0ABY1PPW1_9BACT|nr:hypothetical protein SAMN06265222_101642 [Neorhodopirellula lusitana]